MSHVVAFTVSQKSKNIYQLPVAATMQHFVAYDFTYFVQQCTELTINCLQTGAFDPVAMAAPKEYIRKCHPYFQILVHEDFEQITLDFAIDYICRTQNVKLEELWATHISANKPFWQAVFQRISAYKTGSAINQWDNLVRMQRYAAAKLAFIFDGTPVTAAEYRTRKEYYDLAFSIMAGRMGYEENDLPSVKYYSPALLPGATAILGRLSGELEAVVRPAVNAPQGKRTARCKVNALQDQSAGLIINSILDLPRPGPMEARAAVEACAAMPERIYVPTSFKSIIDLEFNQIIEHEIAFVRSQETRMFVIAPEGGRRIDRFEGLEEEEPIAAPAFAQETAEEQPELIVEWLPESAEPERAVDAPAAEEAEPIAFEELLSFAESTPMEEFQPMEMPAAPQIIEPVFVPPIHKPDKQSKTVAASKVQQNAVKPLFESAYDRLRQVAEMTNDTSFIAPVRLAGEDLNVRCQLVQSELRGVIGKQEEALEFEEWSRSLMQLRIQIVRKQLSSDYLERFLGATEQLYQLRIEAE